MPHEHIAESPEGFLIGSLVGMGQPEKAIEAAAVGDLKLELQVADLVKARDDERLEHAPRSKRRSSAQTLRLRFWKTRQDGRKEAPVDDLIESCQRVPHLMQFFQSDGFVEEAALIGLNILGHRV